MLVARVWMTRRTSIRPARSTRPTRTPTRTSTRRASWSRIWRKNENESENNEKEKEKKRRRKTTVAHIPCGSARKSTTQSRRRSRK
jgi:hypothetical protein